MELFIDWNLACAFFVHYTLHSTLYTAKYFRHFNNFAAACAEFGHTLVVPLQRE